MVMVTRCMRLSQFRFRSARGCPARHGRAQMSEHGGRRFGCRQF
jgi:hypothetical protein